MKFWTTTSGHIMKFCIEYCVNDVVYIPLVGCYILVYILIIIFIDLYINFHALRLIFKYILLFINTRLLVEAECLLVIAHKYK